MKSKLSKIRKKIKAIKEVLKYESFELSSVLSPENEFKIIIGQEFKKLFNPKDVKEEQYILNSIDKISSKVFSKKSKEQSFLDTVDGIFGQQMWFYSVVCGYASLWEMKVKLLASRYGVEIKKPYELRNKKNKKFNITVYKDLSEIIEDFQLTTNKLFKLEFRSLADIRSAVVHSNFDQLRILINNCSPKIKSSHKGNVIVFNPIMPGEKIQNLSDSLDKDQKEAQDIFGWFIEGTNSQLLEDVWNLFDASVANLNMLIEFKAISFDDRKAIFDGVISGKIKIGQKEKDQYQRYFDTSPTMKGLKADEYFERLNLLFSRGILHKK